MKLVAFAKRHMTLAVKPLCSLELFDCLDALVSNDTNNDRLAWNNLLESYQVVLDISFWGILSFFQNDGKTKHVFLLSSFFFVQAIVCWILLVLCCVVGRLDMSLNKIGSPSEHVVCFCRNKLFDMHMSHTFKKVQSIYGDCFEPPLLR